jgi:prepilin-type N-terminal cleavage/methylation domain-containing protein
MLNKLKKPNSKGFTIIEVMIVLAIAGLILLIVFLAVPALQRNSRNTARKGDVGRVGSAATEFVSNNNGKLPAAGNASAAGDAQTIVNNAGSLSQYDFTTTPASDGLNFTVAAYAAPGNANPNNVDKMQLVTKAKCSTGGAVTSGTNRQMAIQYTTESSSGTNQLCVDI